MRHLPFSHEPILAGQLYHMEGKNGVFGEEDQIGEENWMAEKE